MRLNDPEVTSFFYKEREYLINLSFDIVLDAFDVLNEAIFTDYEKACLCLDLLIGEGCYQSEDALSLWIFIYDQFIHKEVPPFIKYSFYGDPLSVEEHEQLIDISADAETIYASFIQAYNIDLIDKQGILTWSKFRALLHNLPSDTPLKRIMQIRAWKPGNNDSEEYKRDMTDLQRYYALNTDREEEDND
ncbi:MULTISPECIES: Gp15 family bacteriophage protein [Enterococcus]|uniref:Gp15 family bacteriophage protein n=1 Tax=Enterococcus TaxID=1350 RepID=UPI000789BE76|nr:MULTISPECIES: Gp15 family bacteriophage protein [Enterococcus]PJK24604.1 hypothetical protein CV769_14610 [Enterococcus mundtii]